MIRLTFLAFSLLSYCSLAVAVANEPLLRVIGVNHEVVYEHRITSRFYDLGSLTERTLEAALASRGINEFRGSAGGVSSINKMGGVLEVLSDTEMNAYGWCYRVDGVSPDLMPNQYLLTGREAVIEWYYAYAHIDHDRWTSMCVPADHMPEHI